MDLHYLEIFNTIATFESYKKASAVLHISQPALSVQIKRLESQIGLKLFDKKGNKVYLNESGIMLFSYTKKIFRNFNCEIIIDNDNLTLSYKMTINNNIYR